MRTGNAAPEQRQLRLAHTLQKVGALLTATLSLEEVFDEILTLPGIAEAEIGHVFEHFYLGERHAGAEDLKIRKITYI